MKDVDTRACAEIDVVRKRGGGAAVSALKTDVSTTVRVCGGGERAPTSAAPRAGSATADGAAAVATPIMRAAAPGGGGKHRDLPPAAVRTLGSR